MKYIKLFESHEYEDNIDDLSTFIIKFISKKIKIKLGIYKGQTKYSIYYNQSAIYRKYIIDINKIDYFHGDSNMFFEFKLSSGIIDKSIYIPEELLDIVLFISEIMEKYSDFQQLIKLSDIKNIISDLTENYDSYIMSKKYNL